MPMPVVLDLTLTWRDVVVWGIHAIWYQYVTQPVASQPRSDHRLSSARGRYLAAAPGRSIQARRSAEGAWIGKDTDRRWRLTICPHSTPFRDSAASDPATREWRTMAPMPQDGCGAAAAWDGKEVLVVGGYTGGGPAVNQRLAVRDLAYARPGRSQPLMGTSHPRRAWRPLIGWRAEIPPAA